MNSRVNQIMLSVLLVPMLAFCCFGFLASNEPVKNAAVFQFAYAGVAFVSVLGLFATWRPRRDAA